LIGLSGIASITCSLERASNLLAGLSLNLTRSCSAHADSDEGTNHFKSVYVRLTGQKYIDWPTGIYRRARELLMPDDEIS